jgi:hypothetical protein
MTKIKLNRNLATDLESAFNQIGCSMMSADFAAKLMAYVYVMGGGNEQLVTHVGLNAGINIAQEKFHLNGGETPDSEGVVLINKYIAELEKSKVETVWLKEIKERYKLKRL